MCAVNVGAWDKCGESSSRCLLNARFIAIPNVSVGVKEIVER